MLERLLDITKRQNTGHRETDANKRKSQSTDYSTPDAGPNKTLAAAEKVSTLQFQS